MIDILNTCCNVVNKRAYTQVVEVNKTLAIWYGQHWNPFKVPLLYVLR